jgi:hypothetical protein
VIPAAVVSLLLARGVEGAEIAVSMVALAICVTLLLQATRQQATSPAVSACWIKHATPFGLRFQHAQALRPSLVSNSACQLECGDSGSRP